MSEANFNLEDFLPFFTDEVEDAQDRSDPECRTVYGNHRTEEYTIVVCQCLSVDVARQLVALCNRMVAQ